jgi:hypothetical protein
MIDLASLTDKDREAWVQYTAFGMRRRGRIKTWNHRFIYVVYGCGGHWEDYARYTVAPTLPEELSFAEPP